MENFVFGVLGAILYPLFGVIFLCIEGIQSIFFAFAGIGDISFGGSVVLKDQVDSDGGIVYFLFQNSVVKNMLMSIMLLALFLIIIFTVMAFIKNAYSAKPKGWKEIIGNSIKGLANFIFIPVCCLLGVWLGNILLQAINGATSNGGSTQMSRTLFIASAYNANQFRTGDFGADKWEDLKEFAEKQTVSGTSNKYEASYIKEGMTTEELANALDDVYANTNVSYHLQWHISDWYNVGLVNYIVLAVGGVFILYVLCSLAFAMVRRLFLLLLLFIISPGVCAMYPLDEGKAVGSWKTKFFEQVVSAYGAVAGLNIFFGLIPIIGKIELFSGPLAGFMNCIIQIFILVSGLLVVNEFISLISGFVGGEDAYSKGKSTMSSSLSKVKGTVSKTTGVFATAAGAKAGGGSFFGSLLKQGADAAGGVFGISGKDMKKAYKDAKENVEKEKNERKDNRESREIHGQAQNLLFGDEAEAKNKSTFWKKIGKAVGDTFGGEIGGVTHHWTEDQYNNAMKKAEGNSKLQKAITEEYVKSETAHNSGIVGNWRAHYNANKKAKEDGKKGPGFFDWADRVFLDSSGVTTVEKRIEKYNQAKSTNTANEGITEAYTGLTSDITQATDARAKQTAYATANAQHLYVNGKDGELKARVLAGDIKDLERRAEQKTKKGKYTKDALEAQKKLNEALNTNQALDEYDKLTKSANEFEKQVKEAAKDFAEIVKNAAEKQKEANKSTFESVAEEIKNSVNSGSSTDDISKAITKGFKELSELIDKKNKNNNGSK